MKAVVIGAGRGRRLAHLTDEIPKTMVPIVGRPMLESILLALEAGGFSRGRDVVFIAGYRAEVVRAAYPELAYVENRDWASNNILLSLLSAREHLTGGFVSSYADIVYRSEAVARLVESPHDITLVCDTDWRRRYLDRSEHPETDAEKVVILGDRVDTLSRRIESSDATAEFIGVMRLTARGAAQFLEAFDRALAERGLSGELHEGRSLQKAYLIDLLQQMLLEGTPIHALSIRGGYMEIDTTEDARHADKWWAAD